jgi:hypothetical protein
MHSLRLLIFCLVATAIGLAGPVAKSFALTPAKLHDIAVAERAVATANTGSTIDLKVASARPCERPQTAWTKCSIDNGFLPPEKSVLPPEPVQAWETGFPQAISDAREIKVFRPPRLG